MNTRINHIQNFPEIAREAKWSVAKLAKACQISERTLRRYIWERFQRTPNLWLRQQRMQEGKILLRQGQSVKEVAADLMYKHPNHFSRDFKKHYGLSPTEFNQPAAIQSQWLERVGNGRF